MRWLLILIISVFASTLSAQPARPRVYYVVLKDAVINPSLHDFLQRALEEAKENEAECLVVQLTTPGGTVESMQDIVRLFLNSPIPIVVFVAPRGGNADSAGAFIVMAAHIAAMAPASRIGAAQGSIPTSSGWLKATVAKWPSPLPTSRIGLGKASFS